MTQTSPRRITLMLKTPNPIFEKWLTEYMNEAEQKGRTKEYEAFNYALMNLRKYKLPLKSVRECKILKGFTKGICDKLNEKQNTYNNQNVTHKDTNSDKDSGIYSRKTVASKKQETSVICLDSDSDEESKNKVVKKCPVLIQAPIATSSKNSISVNKDIVKEDLLLELPSCSYSSETSTQSTSKNKTLKRQASCSSSSSSQSKILKKCSSVSSIQSSQSSVEHFIMTPGDFDVILYVDTCEVVGRKCKIENDPMLSELQKHGVHYEVKNLKVGDFAWICRDKISKKELVLPHIIERKRMDDFAKSIKDGRYYEQKRRLKLSGIQHVTYLIEKINMKRFGLPQATLDQATHNTAIRDGFNVKVTKNIQHTARYLADMTQILEETYRLKTLASCEKENLVEISIKDDLVSLMTFKEFNESSIKNKPMRVSDLFVRMLLQISQMTVDKALGIVEKYPTPFVLKKALDSQDTDREKFLASIPGKHSGKALGLNLSKIISDLFK